MVAIDRDELTDIIHEQRFHRYECPRCCEPLEYFSGLEYIPEYMFCPRCMDWAYSYDGERLFRLE